MNSSAVYSKSGKGVQEATGKTSHLKRSERAVLAAIDGRSTLAEVAQKIGKPLDGAFELLIAQLDKQGFIREISTSGPEATVRAQAPSSEAAEDLDFTRKVPASPRSGVKGKSVDLAAKARAQRRTEEENALSYRAREEVAARANAAARAKERAEREARLRAEAERARAEAEARARAAADAQARAESEAKLRAAQEALERAAAEAEARAKADAERAREQAEEEARKEAEARARREAEERARREAEERARKEAEERARREEEERKKREEEERRKREEAERLRKEAEERARREAEERARKEAEERARREEEERRKREEEERKKREEAERLRKEAEERARREAEERARKEAEERARREEEARRKREEEERKKREEAERLRKEAEERARREAEEKARREAEDRARKEAEERARREEEARRAREEAERRAKEEAERLRKEAEERARKETEERARKEAEERAARERARLEEEERRKREEEERRTQAQLELERTKAAAAPLPTDSLLEDLDFFAKQDSEERAKEEAQRAARLAERQAKDDAERKRREDEALERTRRDEEEARARQEREDEERQAREKDKQRPPQGEAPPAKVVNELVFTDEKALRKEARRAAREQARERRKAAKAASAAAKAASAAAKEASTAAKAPRRHRNWGRPVAVTLVVLAAAAIGVAHLMPLSTASYERAASEALGRPVKIASARFSVLTGGPLNLTGISAGEARIAKARAYPKLASLFDDKQAFSRIELDGVTLRQEALGDLLLGQARSERFSVDRVVASNVTLLGSLPLPSMEVELLLDARGALRSVSASGPDNLVVNVRPAGSQVELEASASGFPLPMLPRVTLAQFRMNGTANRLGMDVTSWHGSLLDGVLRGSAQVRWGERWNIEGVVMARGVNAAVLAPALLSEGKADGDGRFSFAGDPAKLASSARLEGSFTVGKGVLGSFDLARAIQTSGRQPQGRTPFAELSGQGVYQGGTVALRHVSIGAGALNAGASADITAEGALTGRIVADVKTANQTLRTTMHLVGNVKAPQVRN